MTERTNPMHLEYSLLTIDATAIDEAQGFLVDDSDS